MSFVLLLFYLLVPSKSSLSLPTFPWIIMSAITRDQAKVHARSLPKATYIPGHDHCGEMLHAEAIHAFPSSANRLGREIGLLTPRDRGTLRCGVPTTAPASRPKMAHPQSRSDRGPAGTCEATSSLPHTTDAQL